VTLALPEAEARAPGRAGRGNQRAWIAAALVLLAEYLLISLRFDASTLRGHRGGWGFAGHVGALAPLAVVVAATWWLLRRDGASKQVSDRADGRWIPHPWLLGFHVALAAAFHFLTGHLFGEHAEIGSSPAPWLIGWGLLGGASALSLLLGLAGPSQLRFGAWSSMLALPLVVGTVAWLAGTWTLDFWFQFSRATLAVVTALLRLGFDDVSSRPEELLLTLGNFEVIIAPVCSGFEGMGLISVLTVAFLVVSRKQLRFPQALILLPIAVLAAWVGNAIRIAALMVVGAKVDAELAFEAFHSKAGWVVFCAIALSLAAAARSVPALWRSRQPAALLGEGETENPSAAYLLPFLLLLGTALVTGMFARGLDWLYPARLLGPALALYFYFGRHAYADLVVGYPARSFPVPLAAGLVVGVAWLATAPANPTADGAFAAALAQAPILVSFWLVLRALGSIVFVPICEELAFRGFLLRWLIDRDFIEVSFRRFSLLAVLGSSIAFGFIHERWLAGALAGLVFAGLQLRSGRLSDAVLAHATSNAVIAAWAIASGRWSYWV
jgi:exosortase E/protease (VPEID-CTERM system)